MRSNRFRFTILLTLVVGILTSLEAQVVPTDSSAASPLDTASGVVVVPDSSDADSLLVIPADDDDGDFLPSQVEYTASDSITGSPAVGFAHLYNQGDVRYQDIKLTAGYIRINFETSEVYAEGIRDSTGKVTQKPIFVEGGKTYRADVMRYNFETKKAKIKKVITQEGEGFLHGEEVKKVSDAVFYIKNASFTTCSHEHPHFRINTPKAKMISGDKVVTQFAYLEIVDIPTPLMVPFGFFPTTAKRKSGIIIPSYGNNQYRGYFLQNGGYYWAINDYLDLRLTGDIYTQGGYRINGHTAYRKRYKYSGDFSVNYNLIRFGREEFADFVSQAFDNRSDFAITWNHQQDAKARPDFRFSANVNVQSQNFNRLTSTNANQVLNNQLNSSVSFSKTWNRFPFNLNVSLRHNQNNQTKDLALELPQLTFNMKNRLFPFKAKQSIGKKKWYEEIGLNYTMNAVNRINTKLGAPLFTETVFRDSTNNGLKHTIPISANYKIFKNFVLNPSIQYTERWYLRKLDYRFIDSTNSITSDTLNGFFANRSFSASANVSTKVYGQWNYKGGFVKALRHVATPTIGFSYKPDFSDDFWGYFQNVKNDTSGTTEKRNRFTGAPFVYGSATAGLQGNLNFGIQNTLEAKVRSRKDSTGLKKIKLLERFSLNTSYNMAATQFNWSNLGVTASSSALNGLVTANYTASYDFYGFDPDLNTRVNKSALEVNGKWLRKVRQNLAFGLRLNADSFKGDKKKKQNQQSEPLGSGEDGAAGGGLNITEGDIDYYRRPGYVDFNAPWTFRVDYTITENVRNLESTVSQALRFSGDVRLTENWKLGFSSGYDFEAKDVTYTTFDIYRSLHCWELLCTWVPFGFQQSYTLTIRVRSDVLSDLKMERRRGIGDFER